MAARNPKARRKRAVAKEPNAESTSQKTKQSADKSSSVEPDSTGTRDARPLPATGVTRRPKLLWLAGVLVASWLFVLALVAFRVI